MRLLLLTPAEVTRDVRARRAVVAAQMRGYEVVAACGRISGEQPAPLERVQVERAGRRGTVHPMWRSVTATSVRRRRTVDDVRGLVRLVRLALRTAGLVRAARRLGRADVVHANDFGTLPAGYVLARTWSARLVYDAHELYSSFDNPEPRFTRRLTLACEGALARRADAVVTVSEGIAQELLGRLHLRTLPFVVPNAPRRDERPLRLFDEGPLRVVYQGRLGPNRELGDLLAAARADGVVLSLRIPLVDTEELRTALAERGVGERVRVLETVPPDRVVDALADFEVGLIVDRPLSRNSQLSLPNKLFEYLMAGLAVVAPRLESIGPVVDGEGVGLTFEAGDAQGLVLALERLAADRDLLASLRRAARALALERWNAEGAAATLASAWGEDVGGP